jgi:hypothetical protein
VQYPGTGKIVQQYDEAGLWFAPVAGSDGFTRMGGGILGYPDNGTAYVQASLGESLRFGTDDGTSFGVAAVDLAEYSDVVRSPVTVHFVGYRHDGSVVTEDITTAGVFDGTAPVFQTFYFSPGFSGLDRVEIPYHGWSLDNLVLSVPEPAPCRWVLLAAGLLGLRSWRKPHPNARTTAPRR